MKTYTREVVHKYIIRFDGAEKPIISLNKSLDYRATIKRYKELGYKEIWIESKGWEYSYGYIKH